MSLSPGKCLRHPTKSLWKCARRAMPLLFQIPHNQFNNKVLKQYNYSSFWVWYASCLRKSTPSPHRLFSFVKKIDTAQQLIAVPADVKVVTTLLCWRVSAESRTLHSENWQPFFQRKKDDAHISNQPNPWPWYSFHTPFTREKGYHHANSKAFHRRGKSCHHYC